MCNPLRLPFYPSPSMEGRKLLTGCGGFQIHETGCDTRLRRYGNSGVVVSCKI